MVCSFGSAVGSELPVGHERDSFSMIFHHVLSVRDAQKQVGWEIMAGILLKWREPPNSTKRSISRSPPTLQPAACSTCHAARCKLRSSFSKAGEIYNFVKMAFLARKITKLQNFAENYKEIS
jgi:hypothetical protein